ncbi:MAG: hypothetical protein ACI82H_002031 [Alphaproteobacteria bacterium]|jgi:hypothetical protein
MALHLLKLAVSVYSVTDLVRFQKARRAAQRAAGDKGSTYHYTRNFPRRAEEVLDGGSLYWVIRGEIIARQRILGFDESQRPGKQRKRCAIRLAAEVVRTVPMTHRPIQGWRYFKPDDAPHDLKDAPAQSRAKGAERLPAEMARELRELGLI